MWGKFYHAQHWFDLSQRHCTVADFLFFITQSCPGCGIQQFLVLPACFAFCVPNQFACDSFLTSHTDNHWYHFACCFLPFLLSLLGLSPNLTFTYKYLKRTIIAIANNLKQRNLWPVYFYCFRGWNMPSSLSLSQGPDCMTETPHFISHPTGSLCHWREAFCFQIQHFVNLIWWIFIFMRSVALFKYHDLPPCYIGSPWKKPVHSYCMGTPCTTCGSSSLYCCFHTCPTRLTKTLVYMFNQATILGLSLYMSGGPGQPPCYITQWQHSFQAFLSCLSFCYLLALTTGVESLLGGILPWSAFTGNEG